MSQLIQQCFAYCPDSSKQVFETLNTCTGLKVLSIKNKNGVFLCWIEFPAIHAFLFGTWIGAAAK